MQYRYILASRKAPKLNCPYCGAKKHWQRYIDSTTGNILPDEFGRCDNESKCGMWIKPKFNSNNDFNVYNFSVPQIKKREIKVVHIPKKVYENHLSDYSHNFFIQNLLNNVDYPFEIIDVQKIIEMYYIGTVKHSGATCFPYINKDNNIRAVQEKIFDKSNHTDKSLKYHTSWLHSRLKYVVYRKQKPPKWLLEYEQNDLKVSCLFGEHLLNKYPNNPVALVEAPKTAIYGTLYFGFPSNPLNFLWLGVFNLSSLNYNKCKVLKGRTVVLFPDLSVKGDAYKKWSSKAILISKKLPNTTFKVSNFIEKYATKEQKETGLDIADYLIKLDWRDFRRDNKVNKHHPSINSDNTITNETEIKSLHNTKAVKHIKEDLKNEDYNTSHFNKDKTKDFAFIENETIEEEKPDWSKDIKKLEDFFKSTSLPTVPIKLNEYTNIKDISQFIKNHMAAVKANNGNMIYFPYLVRMQELKVILKV